jgi:hypothetical protein
MQTTTATARRAPDAISGRRWYAQHRTDVLACLGAAGGTAAREAALVVLAFDEDPATVARAQVVRTSAP